MPEKTLGLPTERVAEVPTTCVLNTMHKCTLLQKSRVAARMALYANDASQVFIAFLLDILQLKGQSKASDLCGRQVGRWQFDTKTEKFLRCLLVKVTW